MMMRFSGIGIPMPSKLYRRFETAAKEGKEAAKKFVEALSIADRKKLLAEIIGFEIDKSEQIAIAKFLKEHEEKEALLGFSDQ